MILVLLLKYCFLVLYTTLLHCEKSPGSYCTSFTSWGSSTCRMDCRCSSIRHWVCHLHFNSCLVWLYKIRHQKTAEDSSDCWEDCWCSSAHPLRTLYIQSEKKSPENHTRSLTGFEHCAKVNFWQYPTSSYSMSCI